MEEHTCVEVVAGAVIKKDGRFLLVQEKQEKVYGLWNIPAGKVDKGESIEEGAVREVREESGYNVELLRKLDVFHNSVHEPVKHFFEAKIVGGKLAFPQEELLDARWFSYGEVVSMKERLREGSIFQAITLVENAT